MSASPDCLTAYDRIASALHDFGSRPDASGRMWNCPAHDDRNPSLSLKQGNGRAHVKCYAGCDDKDVLSAIGLGVSDLFDVPRTNGNTDRVERSTPRSKKPTKKAPKKPAAVYSTLDEAVAAVEKMTGGTVTDRYRYEDEGRRVLFVVFRIEHRDGGKKEFRQLSPEGSGWKLGLGNSRRVPFMLPDTRVAINEGEPIYIAEGEKDVLALTKAGVPATCNPMGAGGDMTLFAECLDGASTVRVIADRDEPGRAHAKAWADALKGRVGRIEMLEPTEGKDAHDALVTHGLELLEAFAPPKPPVDTTRFVHVGADAYQRLQSAPEPEWLVPDLLRIGKTTVLGGTTMTGKSWFSLQAGSSIAAGVPVWPGVDGNVSEGVVVYIGYDPHMTVEDVARRLAKLDQGEHRRDQGMRPGAWAERFVTVGSSEQTGAFPVDRYRLDEDGCERIAEEILRPIERARGPIRAIVADTLSTALPLGVDENDNPAMTAVITRLSGLALDFRAAALTIHHPTKANSSAGPGFRSSDPMSYFRGAGAIPSAAGVLAGLWAPEQYPAHRVLTCWSNSGGRRRTWFRVADDQAAQTGRIDMWWPEEAPDGSPDVNAGANAEELAAAFRPDPAAMLSWHAFVKGTQGGSYTGASRKRAETLLAWAAEGDMAAREVMGAQRVYLTATGRAELAPFWQANRGQPEGDD